MKKIFYLFAAVLFAGSMMAQVVTLTAADSKKTSFTKDGVTVTAAKADAGNDPVYVDNGKDLRIYAKGTLTISADQDITAISFAISEQGKKRLAPLTVNAGSVVVKGTPDFSVTWTGSAKSVVFTVGEKAEYGTDGNAKAGQLDFTAVTVTMTPPAVYAPTFTPAEDKFEESVDVTLACVTEAAEIFYTIDGAEPTAQSTKYTAAITLTETTTIKAIAIKGEDKSTIASKTYTKKEAIDPSSVLTCAQAVEIAAAAGATPTTETYKAKGYVTEIAFALKDGSMSFWMADTKDGGKVLEAYKCAVAKAEDAPVKGDLVIVTGKLKEYNGTKEFDTGCTCEIVERAPAPEPGKNLGVKTIAEFLELKNTTDTCVLTGIVANIVMDKNDKTQYNAYGNFDLVEIGNSEVKVYIFGLLNAAGESKKFNEMDIDAGDTLTVKAVYKEFNGKAEAENAVFVSVKKGEGGGDEEDEEHPYDEDTDFNVTFASYSIDDSDLEEFGSLYIEATDEKHNYIVLDIVLPDGATNLVAGTYPIDDTYDYPAQTVTAGSVYEEEFYPSYAAILTDDDSNLEKIWWIVSGNVVIDADLNITVNAQNSLGKKVKAVLSADEGNAVENTTITTTAVKAIENGTLYIDNNGVRYDVLGQKVR